MNQAHLVPKSTGTIVVGGGTGGAVCAGMLAEHNGNPILLVESGPDYGPFDNGQWPAELLDASCVPRSHDWNYNSGETYTHRILDFPRARVVGGCSSHNGCTAAIGARVDYDEWAAAGNPGWTAAEVEPLFDLVRDRFRVRTYSMDELTPVQTAFVFAGQAQGLPLAFDLDQYEAGVGIGPMAANIVDGIRWNAAFAFLDPVRDRAHLQIAGNVLVERILVERGHAKGVSIIANRKQYTIHCDRVVLCAGAFGSPAILLRSGIGPAAESRRLGLVVTGDLAGVGQNLLDHPCVQLNFSGTEEFTSTMRKKNWSPDEQAVGRAKSLFCDRGPYDIHVFLVAGANTGHAGLPPISIYGGVMRARSQGTLRLRGLNPEMSPMIDPRYVTDPDGHDRKVLEHADRLLRDMVAVPEFARFIGTPVHALGKDFADTAVSYFHPAGTCKMGPASDPMAVVDAAGGVHGIEGLYVADASIMPAIPRGNINLPTAMIAARVVARLLNQSPTALGKCSAPARRDP